MMTMKEQMFVLLIMILHPAGGGYETPYVQDDDEGRRNIPSGDSMYGQTSCTSDKDRILPQLTLMTIKTLILTTKMTKSPGGTVKLSQGWSKPGSSSSSQFSTLHLHLQHLQCFEPVFFGT